MSIWTAAFWKGAAERAVKTAAQSAILSFGADQFNVIGVDWATVGGFAAGGALLSVLSTIVTGVKTGKPSLVSAEQLHEKPRKQPKPRHDPTLRA